MQEDGFAERWGRPEGPRAVTSGSTRVRWVNGLWVRSTSAYVSPKPGSLASGTGSKYATSVRAAAYGDASHLTLDATLMALRAQQAQQVIAQADAGDDQARRTQLNLPARFNCRC